MSAASNLDWLYHLLGWTLAAAGLLLLVWALFWDRSRGRRRCPKCWYDMSGVPGLRCPECGKECNRERMLFRTRVRRKPLALAMVLLFAGATLSGYGVPRSTWLRQIPGFVLARIIPPGALKEAFNTPWAQLDSEPSTLFAELERRVIRRELSSAQWRVIIERAAIVVPSRVPWPRDQPLHVDFNIPRWLRPYVRLYTSGERAQRLVSINRRMVLHIPALNGFEPAGATGTIESVDVHLAFLRRPPISSININPSAVPDSSRVLKVSGVRLQYSTVPRIADVLQPAEPLDPDPLEQILATNLRYLNQAGPSTARQVTVAFDLRKLPKQGIAVAPRIQILHDGEVVAQAELFLGARWPGNFIAAADLVGDIARIPGPDQLDPTWIVRISGDPLTSLRCQDCTRYWAGAFEIPLSQIRRDPFPPLTGSS